MTGSAVLEEQLDTRWRESNWFDPPDFTVDTWAERNVVLPRAVAAEPGPISIDRTPYLREILRAATDPDVEEVTLAFSTQVGKTMALILVNLFYLDEDPWPCLHVMPRVEDAISINCDRYQKIIEESPRLRRHLTGAANDMTREAIRLNGTTLTFAGSNSPAGLASRAICILTLDETDKYPPFAGREADPIALARERTRTFFNRKIFKVSSPTTDRGYIWQEYQASDRRRYHVPCPHCGRYQTLKLRTGQPGGLRWPQEERDAERILDRRLAWYECEGCEGRIDDLAKPQMLRRGVWVPERQTIGADGKLEGPAPSRRRLGYHLSALYSPWLTWSRIAAEFLLSKDYPSLLMNFRNSWLAEIWEDKVDEVKGEHLRARVLPGLQACKVHAEAKVLTAGVDVQLDCLWYSIRGWGAYGESWLVRAGRVEDWDQLAAIMFQSKYLVVGLGVSMPIRVGFIDMGYRTDEVFEFCKRAGGDWIAVKGDARPTRPFTPTKHINPDGSISRLGLIDTGYYKAKLHRLIRIKDGDPGAWHLCEGLDEDYFLQLTAEQRVLTRSKRTGRVTYEWKLTAQKAPNHLFDCEVYALAAAEVLDVEHRLVAPTPIDPESESRPAELQPTPPPRAVQTPRKRPRFTRIGGNFAGFRRK